MRWKFIITIAALLFIAAVQFALAGSLKNCNLTASPVSTAIGWIEPDNTYRTKGWYTLEPGECKTHSVPSKHIYLFGESYDDLAKWLNDGKIKVWGGIWHERCVSYPDAFDYAYDKKQVRTCKHRVGMKKLRTGTASRPRYYNFIDKNHPNATFSNIAQIRRDLIGVMNWERHLIETNGREAPFSIGIKSTENCRSNCISVNAQSTYAAGLPRPRVSGARILKVATGMPAAEEALEVGDIILSLGGHQVQNASDLNEVLDRIPFDWSSPISMTIYREGDILQGSILPKFFYFNHPAYDPRDAVGTAVWEALDSIPLLFGNEAACGTFHLVGERFDSWANERDFDGDQVSHEYNICKDDLNRKQELYRVLHKDAAVAGAFASLFIGGGVLVKSGKLTKGVTLASRSRKVSRPELARRTFKR